MGEGSSQSAQTMDCRPSQYGGESLRCSLPLRLQNLLRKPNPASHMSDHKEQQAQLEAELQKVILRFIKEYDLTLADAVGTIEVVKLWLYVDQTTEPRDEDYNG